MHVSNRSGPCSARSCWLLHTHAADLSNGFVAHLFEGWRWEGLGCPAAQGQGSDQLNDVLDVMACKSQPGQACQRLAHSQGFSNLVWWCTLALATLGQLSCPTKQLRQDRWPAQDHGNWHNTVSSLY